MYTFLKIQLKKFKDFPTEWVLKIDNTCTLIDYLTEHRGYIIEKALMEEVTSIKERTHVTDSVAPAVSQIAMATGDSFVNVLSRMEGDVASGMCKILDDDNILYVKPNGSYCFDTKDHKLYTILETRKSERFVFPYNKDDVKIEKWPGGVHWYVKVGNISLEIDGKSKWNTYDAAKRASVKFLEEKK